MVNKTNPQSESTLTRPTIIFIVGPTGAGKTSASVSLAEILNIEVINADSRQAYRYMNIGTAKPTDEQKSKAAHHLFDLIDPNEQFSLANYLDAATSTIGSVLKRGSLPVVVGGSGQYIWALAEGWNVPRVEPNLPFRKKMEALGDEKGRLHLHQLLSNTDPAAAESINPNNTRRIIRALEVFEFTGQLFSTLSSKSETYFDSYILGLWPGRENLLNNIENRATSMIEDGWVLEVESLLSRGYTSRDPGFTSAGYKDLVKFIEGEADFTSSFNLAKAAHRSLAKKQMTWFKLSDPRINWMTTPSEFTEEIPTDLISKYKKSNLSL